MLTKEELRVIVQSNLTEIMAEVNRALKGKGLGRIESTLKRIGRGGQLPHWYARLRDEQSLPNMDGKTIGSVVEMLLVAVMETKTFAKLKIPPLKINPARGVDLPDLDLGVKSPSKNYCTSEPFFSAYERLLGSEHDVLVLLTDYQEAKRNPPMKLQIIEWRYLRKTQIADRNLCAVAKKHRDFLVSSNESRAKRVFRFLAYINQSDWRAKQLLRLLNSLTNEEELKTLISNSESDFLKQNKHRQDRDRLPLPDSDLDSVRKIREVVPIQLGVIDALDNWVTEVQKDAGRIPNDNEWDRILNSPLEGIIGMSLALQWRYNFGPLFGARLPEDDAGCIVEENDE